MSQEVRYSVGVPTLEDFAGASPPVVVDSQSGILYVVKDGDTVVAVAGTGGAGLSDGDYGDIVVSSGGTVISIDSAVMTAAGRALVDDANAAAQRATLGLGTAAVAATGDFEAAGAVSTHAALTETHGISAFGASLVDDLTAAAARTTLGIGDSVGGGQTVFIDQSEIIEGEMGPPGLVGPPGATGGTGSTGTTGDPGPKGDTGPAIFLAADSGEDGMSLPGLPGPQGPTGATGTQGIQGDPGTPGTPGSDGADGADGAAGPQGLTGPAVFMAADSGEDGISLPGAAGAAGPQGPTGSAGAAGPAGSPGTVMYLEPDPGEEGPRGLQGERGTAGAAGSQGPAGQSGSILFLESEAGDMGMMGPPGRSDQANVVYTAPGADTAINSVTDVTIVTKDIAGVVAGDKLLVEAWMTILNNSTATRVITLTLDFDGLFDIEVASGALATSATLIHSIRMFGMLDIRATNLAYAMVEAKGYTAAGIASGGDASMLATSLDTILWGTSTSDATGTTTVALKARSANATATQTLRLHNFTIRKVTP